MNIFIDRGYRARFTVIAALLLLFVISGQLFAKYAADEYKQSMIMHDYGAAGYLTRAAPDRAGIVRAFTSEKTGDDTAAGRELLQASGYTAYVRSSLLPEAEYFYRKIALISLAMSILFSAAVLAALLYFTLRQNKKIEDANEDILSFMSGSTGVRLDDRGEGGLSRLFTSVNAMATAQASHIEKEKRNREFLKETVSDISHQLKTPLAALKMYNEIMQDEKTENKVVDGFITKSGRELARMETLILSLLKLARLDAGSIELERKTQNVKKFLEEAVKGFRTRAELEGKTISLSCGVDIAFSFDEEWLLEAVGNIIKNAIDHTSSGDKIEIECDETPLLATITITDTGSGIRAEDIHHIFKRFYRSKSSKGHQGIGIGLALSKAIVEKHGGAVTVESEFGKGASFRLVFPKLTNL